MIRSFLSFLVSNHLLGFSWQVVGWSVGGLAGGILLGVGSFLLVRALGGYRSDRRGARWWRGLVCLVNTVAFALGCAYAGLCEGAWRGVRETVAESPVIRAVNSNLGKVEALFLAGVYHAALGIRNHPGITPMEEARVIADGVDGFVEGRQEIDVQDLRRQLGTIGREVVDQAVAVVEGKAVALVPVLGEPKPRAVLRKVLAGLGRALAHDPARERIRGLRLDTYLDRLLAGLPEEAARRGSPGGITFREMADHLGRVSLVDWVLDGVRSFLRGQHLLAAAVLAVVLAGPVPLFWLARVLRPAEPPDLTGSP